MRRAILSTAILTAILIALAGQPAFLGAQGSTSIEAQFKAAQNKEQIQGDLKGAIEDYRKIANGPDKTWAARAQLRMAECYRKLGDAEATTIYQQLSTSGDAATAAEAKRQLSALRGGPAANRVPAPHRLVWTSPPNAQGGKVSPDGRLIAYITVGTDQPNSSGVFVHDVSAGTDRALVTGPKQPNNGSYGTFSTDGKQLVYMWNEPGPGAMELRLVPTDVMGAIKPRTLFSDSNANWVEPHDWTPDGKFVSVYLERGDTGTSVLGLVSLADGSLRVLKSVAWDRLYAQGMEMCISPDGKYLAYDIRGIDRRQHDIYAIPLDGGPEVPVVTHAADDELLGFSSDGTQVVFVSDRTGSRDVWSVEFLNGKAGKESLVRSGLGLFDRLGMTRAGALFYSTKGAADLPLVKVAAIDVMTGRLVSPPRDLATEFLGRNEDPIISPDGKRVAYISDRVGLGGDLLIAIRSVANPREVKEARPALREISDLMGWWPDSGSILVAGIDSQDRHGVFRINADSGESALLFDGSGLLQISTDGSKVFYDRIIPQAGDTAVIERDIATGREREVFRGPSGGRQRLQISPDGRTIYFRRPVPVNQPPHELVARNVDTGEERILAKQPLGQLNLSPDGEFIATATAGRLSLIPTNGAPIRELGQFNNAGWRPDSRAVIGVRTVQVPPAPGSTGTTSIPEYWLLSLDGGQPIKIDLGLGTAFVYSLNASRDGHLTFLQRERPTPSPTEVWVLEQLLSGTKR